MSAYISQTAVLLPIFLYFIFDLVKNDILKIKKKATVWHDKDGRIQIKKEAIVSKDGKSTNGADKEEEQEKLYVYY